MAQRNRPSHSRQVSPRKATPSRRAHKRLVREDALQQELELREHPPTRAPQHRPRSVHKVRPPFWKYVQRAVGVLLLVGIGEMTVAALTAKPFEVSSFEISGCASTDVDKVHDLAEPLIGQNWFRSKRALVERQIEELPSVQSAHVSRVFDWPPRLHVDVTERQAFAKIGSGDDWWVVDSKGVVFRRAKSDDKELYAVTSPKLRARLGWPLPAKEWAPVREISQALQNNGDKTWDLRRIYFDKDGSVALRLTGGFHDETLIRLGSDHWNEKITRARQALAYFERTGRRAAVLNLVSYDMPQWTPRSSHSSSPAPVAASTPTTDNNPPSAAEAPSET